ncbi:MAG TPA: hypothetical protein VNO23_06335 [Candidatus Binatia bacterium]|nr:hypothetical protein [Candidatus Binatia bacterium]
MEHVAARLGVSPTTGPSKDAELGIPARPRGPMVRAPADIARSADLAWVVGLIATDGKRRNAGQAVAAARWYRHDISGTI